MKYSEEELALLPVDDVADAGEPDRAEDIRPIIHSSSSHGAVDGDEDDDLQAEDDEDAVRESTDGSAQLSPAEPKCHYS